jgi:hypothetical protein
MAIIIHGGTDGPTITYDPITGEWKVVPGWEPERINELARALTIIREAVRFQTPGLAAETLRPIREFVQKEISAHLNQGDVLIIR